MFLSSWALKQKSRYRNSLAVQQLGLCASTEGGTGLIPGQGTKIPKPRSKAKKKKKDDSLEVTCLFLRIRPAWWVDTERNHWGLGGWVRRWLAWSREEKVVGGSDCLKRIRAIPVKTGASSCSFSESFHNPSFYLVYVEWSSVPLSPRVFTRSLSKTLVWLEHKATCHWLFFSFKHLYWSIIALQWCVSFCFITKWISYTYTYIPMSLPSCVSFPPSLSHPSRWSQSTELISLCYAAASH